jgi:hypothetical protein
MATRRFLDFLKYINRFVIAPYTYSQQMCMHHVSASGSHSRWSRVHCTQLHSTLHVFKRSIRQKTRRSFFRIRNSKPKSKRFQDMCEALYRDDLYILKISKNQSLPIFLFKFRSSYLFYHKIYAIFPYLFSSQKHVKCMICKVGPCTFS